MINHHPACRRFDTARGEYDTRVAAIPAHVTDRDRERAVAVFYARMLDRLAREARRADRGRSGICHEPQP